MSNELVKQDHMLDLMGKKLVFPASDAKQLAKSKRRLQVLGALIAVLAVMGCWGAYQLILEKQQAKKVGQRLTYLSLRLIDRHGRPVSGARIQMGSYGFGVSDSFGEWNRYYPLQGGEQILLHVEKNIGEKKLIADRLLTFPRQMLQESNWQIRRTILLQEMSIAVTTQTPQKAEDAVKVSKHESSTTQVQPLALQQQSLPYRVSLQVEPKVFSKSNQLGQKRYDVLRQQVYPQLAVQLKRRGIQLSPTSPYKIRLAHVSGGAGQTLIRTSFVVNSGEQNIEKSFLSNYHPNTERLVHRIVELLRYIYPVSYPVRHEQGQWWANEDLKNPAFWSLKNLSFLVDHQGQPIRLGASIQDQTITKRELKLTPSQQHAWAQQGQRKLYHASVEYWPPNTGWRKITIKFVGKWPRWEQAYVSGFPVMFDDQKQQYWSWAPVGRFAMVTVLHDDQPVLRERRYIQKNALLTLVSSRPSVAIRYRKR